MTEILSKQEIKVYNLILDGLSNAEMAKELYIEEVTVKTHIKNILKKLRLKNRHQLMAKVIY